MVLQPLPPLFAKHLVYNGFSFWCLGMSLEQEERLPTLISEIRGNKLLGVSAFPHLSNKRAGGIRTLISFLKPHMI